MKFSFLSLLFIVFISCKTTSNAQNNSKISVDKISWIQDLKEEFSKESFRGKAMIIQYTYKKEKFFLVDNCYQCPDGISILYNSKKEKICEFGGIIGSNSCPDFSEKSTEEKILYKNF